MRLGIDSSPTLSQHNVEISKPHAAGVGVMQKTITNCCARWSTAGAEAGQPRCTLARPSCNHLCHQCSRRLMSDPVLQSTQVPDDRVPGRCLCTRLDLAWPLTPHPRNAVISCDTTDSGYWNFGVKISSMISLNFMKGGLGRGFSN